MNQHFSDKDKKAIIDRHLSGETITSLAKEFSISRTTIYTWKNNYVKGKKPVNLIAYKNLENTVLKQLDIIKILQSTSNLVNSPSLQKYDTITEMSKEYNVATICEALCVPKGSYYNHILRAKKDNSLANMRRAELTPIIENIYHENKQIYGADKVSTILRERGYKVSKKLVSDIMHKNNWFSIRSFSKTLHTQNQKRKENILNQNFTAKDLMKFG